MTKIRTAALAFAGILAITATSATSASAQWRGHHGGRGFGPAIGIGAGIAAGALIGSAVAAQGYGPNYYYDEPGYAPGYGAPVYAQPYGYELRAGLSLRPLLHRRRLWPPPLVQRELIKLDQTT